MSCLSEVIDIPLGLKYLSFLLHFQRQDIDAKYKTGSGQRAEGDFLTELEQGALDYAGEEVTLGEKQLRFLNFQKYVGKYSVLNIFFM